MSEPTSAPEKGGQPEEQPQESYASAAEKEKQRLLAELEARQHGLAAKRARNLQRRTRRLLISIMIAVILAIAVIVGGLCYQQSSVPIP